MIGGRWGAGNETNPNLEYLFFSFFFSPPYPNLFQQLYQILTDFDIRFYMYELLKVSGIAHDSLDGETRNESGSSGAHGALLLRGYLLLLCSVQNPSLITWEGLGRDQVTWLVAVRYCSQTGGLWSPPKSL